MELFKMRTEPDDQQSVGTPTEPKPFPGSDRVVYKKNPLVQVVCQLSFPSILRVDVEPPARFQERIRSDFPIFWDKSSERGGFPSDLPSPIANIIWSSGRPRPQSAYDFVSADRVWTVGLTREFLSLSTSDYRRWEDFATRLQGPLQSLIAEYAPAWFGRIGLRYQNLIHRSNLGLSNEPWSSLLQPHLSGILSATNLQATVAATVTQTTIKFDDQAGYVNIRHGLVQPARGDEIAYLIDNDFFTDKQTRTEDVSRILSFFNHQSGRLFRWCITPRLHEAMGPDLLESD
jgi:uncharacterized protein (TIGR04255 family)